MDRNTPGGLGRRTLLAAGASAVLAPAVRAQAAWPARPIKLIVPFPPGGSNDILSRAIADKLGARLGQPIVIDNRGGAGGTLGTDAVAKSAPDGYTLLFASTSITTNAAVGKKLPYDLQKDLEPIGLLGAGPFAVTVSNSLGVTTLKEFLDLARAKPKGISYGSAGVGGLNHLGTEMLASVAKIQLLHVPYKGIGPAVTDMMGGNLQMALPTLSSMSPHLKTGKLRFLAMTGEQRSPLAPDLPTMAEAGLPFQLEVWWGLLGPARMPPAVVKRLNEDLNAVLAMPDMKELLGREGAVPRPGTSEEFRTLIRTEMARWAQLVKEKDIPLE